MSISRIFVVCFVLWVTPVFPFSEKLWEQKAARHEAESIRLQRQANALPIRHKWPSLANVAAERERELAQKAREQARRLAKQGKASPSSEAAAVDTQARP